MRRKANKPLHTRIPSKEGLFAKKMIKGGVLLASAAALFFLGRGAGYASDRFLPEAWKPEFLKSSEAALPTAAQLEGQTDNWGLGFGAEGAQPTGNVPAEELKQYDAYYLGGSTEKKIYLTFDCGYENGNTEPILDALKKHNAPAAFFVVGHYLETAPELVKRMVEEGHTVGNHTFHHPDMSAISSKEAFQKEVDEVAALYEQVTGQAMEKYYRPPQGKYSMENLKMAQELGYQTFFWSLAYVDWNQDSQPTKEEAFGKLLGRIHPGAVVLLHNTSSTNGAILDELLTKWEEQGYQFCPLSELAEGTGAGGS